MQQHETCRAILSAVKVMQSEPLSQKAKDLLSTISRNANEAAEEIEYLQTAASVYRVSDEFPKEYDDCKFTLRERQFVDILYRAKQQTVVFESLMAQIYANGSFHGRVKHEDGVNRDVLKAFAYYARQKIAKHRKTLEKAGYPSVIETVWGVGFRLVHLNKQNADKNGKAY